MQGFWTVLPMAVVMSAGPQIVTATFLATSQGSKRNSLAFLGGVATATTIGVTVFFLLGSGTAGKQKEGKDWLDWVIIGLLVFLLIWVFVKRKETQPPKWMGRLQEANARFAVTIGFLLYILMPTDLVAMATVGAYIARQGEPWWHTLGFVVLTVLIAGLPFIVLLALGKRAESVLPRIREWMNANSWIVNEAVLLFFLAMALF
jgi:Sap, sulfolipid-1-addressing protein/Type IV secretion system pilin